MQCTTDAERLANPTHQNQLKEALLTEKPANSVGFIRNLWKWTVLISPFFFWGTSMVAMKAVLPKVGPFCVSSCRLIPPGVLLIGFAKAKATPMPSGFRAWLSISLFALINATLFQGFLCRGLLSTSAGLGAVIIDSQPLTVALLAALLLGESISRVGAAGLALGVAGLVLLEAPTLIGAAAGGGFSVWETGEWWMFLAAQCMAVGTVMMRWVSKFSDPVMVTGWHMVIGGVPLLAVSWVSREPGFGAVGLGDFAVLVYTAVFGGAIGYGVFFYNATTWSLTRLSSLLFLTPVFAAAFGAALLGDRFSSLQLVGAALTLVAICMVNYRKSG